MAFNSARLAEWWKEGLLGILVGLGFVYAFQFREASFTILFPLSYLEYRFSTGPLQEGHTRELAPELSDWRYPESWLKRVLLSQRALESVSKGLALGQAVPGSVHSLLTIVSDRRLLLRSRPMGMQVAVLDRDPRIAVILAKQFLNYLRACVGKAAMFRFSFESGTVTEEQKRLCAQLDRMELDIGREYWLQSQDGRGSTVDDSQELSRREVEYQSLVMRERSLKLSEVNGRLCAQCYVPDFEVLEPVELTPFFPAWTRFLLGFLIGWQIYLLLSVLRRTCLSSWLGRGRIGGRSSWR